MKTSSIRRMDLPMEELEAILQRAKAVLSEEDYNKLRALVDSFAYLTHALEDKRTSIERLRKLLFGSSSEKTRDVIETPRDNVEGAAVADSSGATPRAEKEPVTPPQGHGRHGADAYEGAEKVRVPHPILRSGDPCPECKEGTVYELAQPGVLVRIVGQAPVQAKVYELTKLRCNLCGKVLTAPPPVGVGSEKYDATAGGMIALLKYGSGLPFHRLQGLQGNLGIPLPASTQWDIVHAAAKRIEPVYTELIRQAAQGEVLHNDDTAIKILDLMGKRAEQAAEAKDEGQDSSERRGMFTSGIVSTREGRRIALFFSGRRHAGENLADVLAQRAKDLGPPIQMCDALSRNLPAELKTLVANCLAHGRRPFVEVASRFPEECRYVLERLGEVYRNDAIARERNLSPAERLRFHQTESGPIMEKLQTWLIRQFEERLVEPNSALGEAISYLLKHWEKLTLFLRQPGAPLDNNICERALKKAILHRKNSLFYKTCNGAHVGDVFMSLIHTCQLCEANPLDYLTELQRHAKALPSNPSQWMPWNYSSRRSVPESGREMLHDAGWP
jgi:transposase